MAKGSYLALSGPYITLTVYCPLNCQCIVYHHNALVYNTVQQCNAIL